VAAVDAIAEDCSPEPLSSHDLVHGNFNLATPSPPGGRLWVIDVEALGVGPRACDLAETLLVTAEFGHVTESAATWLWGYGAGLDRPEFAICAGSVGLTTADAFVPHHRTGQAAGRGRRNGAGPGAGPGHRRRMTVAPWASRAVSM